MIILKEYVHQLSEHMDGWESKKDFSPCSLFSPIGAELVFSLIEGGRLNVVGLMPDREKTPFLKPISLSISGSVKSAASRIARQYSDHYLELYPVLKHRCDADQKKRESLQKCIDDIKASCAASINKKLGVSKPTLQFNFASATSGEVVCFDSDSFSIKLGRLNYHTLKRIVQFVEESTSC